jgi:hypothetical protein
MNTKWMIVGLAAAVTSVIGAGAQTAIAAEGAPSAPASQSAQSAPSPAQLDAKAIAEVVQSLASKLETIYVNEDVAKKMAAALRANLAAGLYNTLSFAPDLARKLTQDLSPIAHDKHLNVNFNFDPPPAGPPGPPPAAFLDRMRKLNGAIAKVEILRGNVGYLQVNGVPPYDIAKDAVAAAFKFLQNTDALIIDNRGNGGGDPSTVALYMSYLSDGPSYLVNTFRARDPARSRDFKTTELGKESYGSKKPVFVLNSPFTFSGGEELAYDIQSFKRGVIVGSVTGGGANPTGGVPLGRQFIASIPNAAAVNPVTGTNWEGVGVKPDVAVAPEDALNVAHQLALERLMADATDPGQKALLEAMASTIEPAPSTAKSGRPARLPNARVLGSYTSLTSANITSTVVESKGELIVRVPGRPDATLRNVSGDRYEAGPGVYVTFYPKGSEMRAFLEFPGGGDVLAKR